MKSRRLCLRLIAAAALAAAAWGTAGGSVSPVLAGIQTCGSGPAIGSSCTYTYSAPGSVQFFVPPAGVTSVSVHAIGGRGGSEDPNEGAVSGGAGTDVQISGLSVTPGSVYYVNVAGNGLQGDGIDFCDQAAIAGGYNGGGSGGGCGGGSGGGASVFSSNNPATASGALVVAAGGGGGGGGALGGSGGNAATANTADGDPGLDCASAGTGGGGGTTSADGAAGAGFGLGDPGTGGAFLQGGDGGDEHFGGYGAGGGAGFHGGGGGGSSVDATHHCGGGGGAGSSYAVSGTASYTPDTSGTPGIDITWSPTGAAASHVRVVVLRGWTTMTWRSTTHVLGFNVYRGSQRLNRVLVGSTSHYFSFRLHEVVRHPLLRAVMAR
jgi:hypothetical protein